MISNPSRNSVARTPKPLSGFGLFEIVLVVSIIGVIIALCLPANRVAREPARRSQCRNNLKQIGLALQNYHDVYHTFPPAYTVDENGKRLHSWRTLILPFMDQKHVYAKIDLTRAWDDPVNAEAQKMGFVFYRCPSATSPETHANYLAVVTSNSCLRPGESPSQSEIQDGTSRTLILVEADNDHAVHWMSPNDADESMVLAFGPKDKLVHTGGFHVLIADGTVRFLSATISVDNLRALISIAGKEPVSDF